jgi:hypothetical protein
MPMRFEGWDLRDMKMERKGASRYEPKARVLDLYLPVSIAEFFYGACR